MRFSCSYRREGSGFLGLQYFILTPASVLIGRLHKADEGDVAGLHLPVVIFFVETTEKVNSILPALLDMVTDGMVEAHPTEILRSVIGKEKVVS